jgi:hypothetical protein
MSLSLSQAKHDKENCAGGLQHRQASGNHVLPSSSALGLLSSRALSSEMTIQEYQL